MNYLKSYIALMRKARKRNWVKKISPCYVEEHHIFPVSIFGPNNITVFLTAREHYIAHALLYKALKKRYGPNHSRAVKMRYAYWCMSNGLGKRKSLYVNSRLYEKLRGEFSKDNRGENHPMWGKTHSPEARKKISESTRGENNPMWGSTHSPEAKKKISEKLSGENNPNRGRTLSPEHKKKISEAKRGENNPMWGSTHSPEAKKKMSEKLSGENNPNWGKTFSPEHKKKLSEAKRGKMWITNGEVSRLIDKNSPIPDGFKRGMAKAQSGTGLTACESSSE